MNRIAQSFLADDARAYRDFEYALGNGKTEKIRIFEPSTEDKLWVIDTERLYTSRGKRVPTADIMDKLIEICFDPESNERVFDATMRNNLLKSPKPAILKIYNDFMSYVAANLEDYSKN